MGDHIQKRKDKSSSRSFRANYDQTFRGKNADTDNKTKSSQGAKKGG
jgi:hypothetical protein